MSLPETSIAYLFRIMQVLLERETITVTNLAMLSRTNHKRCNVLLARLEETGFVSVKSNGKNRYVALTESGLLFAKKLVEVNELKSILYA